MSWILLSLRKSLGMRFERISRCKFVESIDLMFGSALNFVKVGDVCFFLKNQRSGSSCGVQLSTQLGTKILPKVTAHKNSRISRFNPRIHMVCKHNIFFFFLLRIRNISLNEKLKSYLMLHAGNDSADNHKINKCKLITSDSASNYPLGVTCHQNKDHAKRWST